VLRSMPDDDQQPRPKPPTDQPKEAR
jgi:hypothetical protein